ncbi:glycosyltransferase [Aestuariibacter salexigens]|uniref:glycosyltransferase n=1 Tax=Aestuariibacter salexigens TaxID=226010 RepID=UPI0004009088|nr:glycosyltransferase [Aestuariibacter salexigens]
MRTAYFVLGMHRSGTSAIASTFHHLGVSFGEALLPATEDNPKGYFENKALQAFNEELLVTEGHGWDSVFFDVDDFDPDKRQRLVRQATKILESEFGIFQQFGLKDPRLCLLFPIWEEACKALDIDIKVVLAYRHPAEVAQSLKARNGMSLQNGLALWADHMSKAERYSRDYPRCLVSYHRLLTDFDNTTSDIRNFTGVSTSSSLDRDNIIDAKLRHYHQSRNNLADIPTFIEAINKAYESGKLDTKSLDKAARDLEHLKAFFYNENKKNLFVQVFDDRKKYKAIKDDYFAKLQHAENQAEKRDKKYQDAEQQLVQLNDKNKSLQDAIQQKDERIRTEVDRAKQAEDSIRQLQHKLNVSEIDAKHFDFKISKLSKENDDLKQALVRLNEIKQEKKDAEKLCASLKSELSTLKEQLSQSKQNEKELVSANDALTDDIRQQDDKIQKLNEHIQTMQAELASKECEIEDLHISIQRVQSKLAEKTKEFETALASQRDKLTNKTSEFENAVATLNNKHAAKAKQLIAEFQRDKQTIKDQLKSAHKQTVSELSEQLTALEHKQELVNEKTAQWIELIVKPLSTIAAEQYGTGDSRGSVVDRFSASFLSRKMERATRKFLKAIDVAKHVPMTFVAQFDEQGYYAANEDVEVEVDAGKFSCALEHFLYFGFDEALSGKRTFHPKGRFFVATHGEHERDIKDYVVHLRDFYDAIAARRKAEKITQQRKAQIQTESSSSDHIQEPATVPAGSPNGVVRPAPNYIKATDTWPSVDIILPVYNALDDVKACISSLYSNQTVPFNLIVIDDCSETDTRDWLISEQQEKGFTLLRNEQNLRFTKTVNRGLAESKGDYVVLLNSDTIVTAYWLEKILCCFNSDKQTGIVGPLSNAASWQTVPVREDTENGGWLVNEIPAGYSIELMGQLVETVSTRQYPSVPSVNGFCYVIKRDVINTIGQLDEEYFPTGYGEEDDFSIRARKAGFTIRVADDTYIFHAKSKSYTKEVRKVLTVGGRKSLDKKHGKEEIENLIAAWKAEPCLPQIGKDIQSFMQVSSGNRKVVYTAIFGNYDHLKVPEYINPDWDYVCFTDNPDITSDVFTVKCVSPRFENTTKNARMIKILSHLFLIGYDISLWIDGSVKLRGRNINELIENNLSEHYISLHRHVKRACVYEEQEACALAQKDGAEILAKQVEFYRIEGMPADAGLFETAEIARIQASQEVQRLNSLWWQQLDAFSIRDQVSLPYVFWKYGFSNHFMEGNQWLDAYFHMYKHNAEQNKLSTPVEIVLPVERQASQIAEYVARIFEKTWYAPFSLSVLLPDDQGINESTRNELIEKYDSRVSFHTYKGAMSIENLNAFIKAGTSELVCLLSEDVRLFNSDWLDMLVDGMHQDELATIAGPTVLNTAYDFVASGVRIKRKEGEVVDIYNSRKLGGTGTVSAVHQACVLIQRTAFNKLKGFATDLGDTRSSIIDLCHRNAQIGFNCRLVLNSEIKVTDDVEHIDLETLQQRLS